MENLHLTKEYVSVNDIGNALENVDTSKLQVAKKIDITAKKKAHEGKRAHAKNNGDVGKTMSARPKDKTSKRTKRHDAAINNLVQQGWSVINKSKHQITVVKIPEPTPIDGNSTASNRGGVKTGECVGRSCVSRKSRKDKFEAQSRSKILHKATSFEKRIKETQAGSGNGGVASVSHQKKSLLRRFVLGSRKLMGRFVTCGKLEE
ncbi:hypothetical protein LOTGIDRAFT_235546 [Lottia gigantea]|uniref:Uncharacterized protein n=1 Tax=Lottia gigantea TaxID=225164 RepID=V3ZUD0_LOTGI|nr:hypothetical protein LOTGIDRAFT_235546 [Lottia gigantea]ESO86190.1 hypothetical protein LOTGIDRAFT_235546 [Lottia gigantea]